MRDFRSLVVWEKAHALTLAVYKLSARLPKDEQYRLRNQVRRAAASIPANIAEGCGRDGSVELARFLRIALGSASELEYYLILLRDLALLKTADCERVNQDVLEVKRMLAALIRRLAADRRPANARNA